MKRLLALMFANFNLSAKICGFYRRMVWLREPHLQSGKFVMRGFESVLRTELFKICKPMVDLKCAFPQFRKKVTYGQKSVERGTVFFDFIKNLVIFDKLI